MMININKVAVDHATSGIGVLEDDGRAVVVAEEMPEEPLSPKSFMYLHGRTLPHIVVTMGFDSPIVVEAFREKLPLTLLKHPRFSSVLVGDEANNSKDLRWVRVQNVNIDDHIVIASIDPSLHENLLEADKFLEDYLYNLSKTSLKNTSKPLWEFHVFNLKTSSGAESIGIFRVHHSLGDGTSLMSLLLTCTRQVIDPNALPMFPTSKKKEKKAKNLFLAVWCWILVFWNTTIGVLMFLATILFLQDSDVLIKENREINTKARRFVHRTVSLDDMKLIKNTVDGTINDVALGIIEAGFSRYLFRRFNDKGEGKATNFVKDIRMRVALVVNLRPFSGIQNLADMMDKDNKVGWGNQTRIVLLPLSIGLLSDPLDYVRKAKVRVDRKKRSLEAHCSFNIGVLALKLFGTKIGLLMSGKALRHASILVSNIPGPVEQISLYGHTVRFIAPSGYGLPYPVIIHLQSYMNKMNVILSVDEDADIDPHQLCDNIVESLILVKDAIVK